MALEQEIPDLDRGGLRRFAFTVGAVVALLFGALLPWLLGAGFPWWPWALAGVLGTWGVAAPGTLRPLYRGWMRFGLVMHRITTPLILGLVYFLVITPVALLFRLIGRDTMRRRIAKADPSYRVPKEPGSRKHMERPF